MSLSVRRVIKPNKGIIRGQLVVLGLLDGVPVVVLADGVLTFCVAMPNSDELSWTARDEGPDQILQMIRGWISRVY